MFASRLLLIVVPLVLAISAGPASAQTKTPLRPINGSAKMPVANPTGLKVTKDTVRHVVSKIPAPPKGLEYLVLQAAELTGGSDRKPGQGFFDARYHAATKNGHFSAPLHLPMGSTIEYVDCRMDTSGSLQEATASVHIQRVDATSQFGERAQFASLPLLMRAGAMHWNQARVAPNERALATVGPDHLLSLKIQIKTRSEGTVEIPFCRVGYRK